MKKNLKKIVRNLFISIICKLAYDYLIFSALPSKYIYGISYGLNFSLYNCIISWIIFLFISCYTYVITEKNDGMLPILLRVLFYLYYIPVNSSNYLNNTPIKYVILSSCYWIILVMFSGINIKINSSLYQKIQAENNKKIVVDNRKLYCICLLLCVGCIIYGYQYNGLNLTLDFTDIYDVRAQFVGSTNTIQSILFHFGGSLFVPIAILFSLQNKNFILLAISIISELAIFSIARQKSNLFIIVLAFAFYYFKKSSLIKNIKKYIPLVFSSAFALTILQIKALNSYSLFMMFIRRLMYYPAWLNTIYFDYFDNHKLLLWTQEVFLINHFKIGRYKESVLSLINNAYFNGLIPSPNSGLFSEAYMHFGIIGALFYPMFVIIILKIIFSFLQGYSYEIQLFIVFQITMSVISSPISGGVFVLKYILFIFTTILMQMSEKEYSNVGIETSC